MSTLDIETSDLEGPFELLDTSDDMASVEEFLMGTPYVRYLTKSIDMAQLMSSMGRLEHAVNTPLLGDGSTCEAS